LRFDETHRKWAVGTALAFLVSLLIYVPYASLSRTGPSGGSPIGLTFGIAGYGLMIFAGLLSLRKKYTVWRIGRAQTWMRGHIWLGLLSYPLILFHAGFAFGGSLTRVMMWMFTLVIVTGILGAALQHYMPRYMTERVPMETIYYQIDRVQAQLVEEADGLFASFAEAEHGTGVQVTGTISGATATTLVRISDAAASKLKTIYHNTIRAYLATPRAYSYELADRRASKLAFAQMRTLAPESLHALVDDLENICEEKRDLDRQSRLHRILHSWLLVHVPLSYALILLGAIHAVMALRF